MRDTIDRILLPGTAFKSTAPSHVRIDDLLLAYYCNNRADAVPIVSNIRSVIRVAMLLRIVSHLTLAAFGAHQCLSNLEAKLLAL